MPSDPSQINSDPSQINNGAKRASLTVSVLQMCSGIDLTANTARVLDGIHQACDEGANIVATPEMTTLVDQDAERLKTAVPVGEAVTEFAQVAKDRGIWLIIGSMVVKDQTGKLANRCFVFSPDGQIAARYDKLHMFDVSLPNGEKWRESSVYTPGERAVLLDIGATKVGLTICYDLRFPSLFRRLAQHGAEVFFVPAAFTRPTGKSHWEILLRARAIETGAFVVAPAQGGKHEDGRETYGHSMIIDPWGDILAHKNDDQPGLITAELVLDRSVDVRHRIPNLSLERDFEIYTSE
ncbi:MAG: carbon-nitrogen hydrolase family protein [Pseudomonadota bacterium]